MNYITTPDGKKRPFRFSWKALRQLANEMGIQRIQDLVQEVSNMPVEKITSFIFIGFEHGAKREAMPVDFTPEDVDTWVDERFGIFQEAMEAFSRDFGAGLDEGNAREAKARR